MLVLGIETSCDETAAAIVEDGTKVLASVVSSQVDIHAKFGGIVPEVAARQHLLLIDGVVAEALARADLAVDDLDLIAVTQGPGLIGALLVGVSYAKGLSAMSEIPLVPVDHVHAHVHGALLGVAAAPADIFPCVTLVVSGGHTNLYFMPEPTVFQLIANTRDDACGECFDKVAKMLGLGYPGGPLIERLAAAGDRQRYAMPRVFEGKSQLAFSYSGLKTHMANLIHDKRESRTAQDTNDLCASFQEAALGQLLRKIEAALLLHPESRSLLIAGGVAANQRFRALIGAKVAVPALFPQLEYCSDNAAMIAAFGFYRFRQRPAAANWHWNKAWDAYSRYDFQSVQS